MLAETACGLGVRGGETDNHDLFAGLGALATTAPDPWTP